MHFIFGKDGFLETTVPTTFNVLDPFNDGSAIAYYPFDGDTEDKIGGINGTSGTPLYTTGVNGNALDLPANTSNVIRTSSRVPAPDSFSVSFWGKRDTANDGWFLANRSSNTTGEEEFQFLYYNTESGLVFNLKTPDGWFSTTSTSLLYGNTHGWKYITATVDDVNKTIKLYIDGGLEAENTYTGTRYKSATFTTFGAFWSSTIPIDGALDDVHFFNKTLTQAEVTELYQNMGGV